MYNDYSEKLANLIVQYAVHVEPDSTVMIQAPINAKELVREIYREVIQAGGHVVHTSFSFNGQQEIFYRYASEEQLKYLDPIHLEQIKRIQKLITIISDYNTRALTNIPPEKKALNAESKMEIQNIFLERISKKELDWNGAPYPCDAFALEANMGRLEYLEFVYTALHLQDDPIGYWKAVEVDQEKIIEILDKGSEFRIVGEDTDLVLGIDGRKWVNCCGHLNLPDGEVFTGPHEDGVDGTIRFTYPGIFQGTEIEDIKLRFKEGKVIEHDAAKGKELLAKLLTTTNADILGELAVGTNYGIQRFTKNMLFDEKMGGTVHLALGGGIPETGSKNQSAIHWDILKDMKDPEAQIFLDGELIYREGQWLIQ
ncbi:MAG: aminopeptidase [Candidatus Heimdallarchaeota archaeon]|nr:MAG: aminopeptidase [Candidatus Heimdallarchaeota archaeon]